MKLTRCLMVGLYGIENSGVRHLTSMLKQRGGYRADLMFFKDWRHNRVEWPTEDEYGLLVDLIERDRVHALRDLIKRARAAEPPHIRCE